MSRMNNSTFFIPIIHAQVRVVVVLKDAVQALIGSSGMMRIEWFYTLNNPKQNITVRTDKNKYCLTDGFNGFYAILKVSYEHLEPFFEYWNNEKNSFYRMAPSYDNSRDGSSKHV